MPFRSRAAKLGVEKGLSYIKMSPTKKATSAVKTLKNVKGNFTSSKLLKGLVKSAKTGPAKSFKLHKVTKGVPAFKKGVTTIGGGIPRIAGTAVKTSAKGLGAVGAVAVVGAGAIVYQNKKLKGEIDKQIKSAIKLSEMRIKQIKAKRKKK